MVKRSSLLVVVLVVAVAFAPVYLASRANAQTLIYSIDHQWCQLYINQDGTVDLTYNLTLTVTSGVAHAVDIGMPKADFTVGQAVDQYGHQLSASDTSSGGNYQATITLNQPLSGGSVWFTLTTNVAGMIYNDTTNPGNFGMEFAPEWMPVPISDVRVQIVLPTGVGVGDVVTLPDKFWNNTSTVDGNLAVFWQIPVLQANQQYLIGVSFPARFMPNYNPGSSGGGGFGGGGFGTFGPILIFAAVIGILIIGVAVLFSRKGAYSSPSLSMETLGIRRGLTAVEASYLLDLKPPQIVTEILYSLLQKRAVWAEATKPSLKLRVLAPYENKTGTPENPLRYYEIDFLAALKPDGNLDEVKLAHTVMSVRDTVEEKLRGYSRKDTVDYYRKIVTQAWTQVEQAGTVDLASNAYDQQLLWLLLDPNQRAKTETVFRGGVLTPNPLWFWWWYGYTIYHPNPTYTPNVNVPAQSGKPPAIPGAEFANNIATAVEGTSSSIVLNLEKFANSILPPGPKASHEPARQGASCVCACHACACACACVSCACACAGGGAH
jgi:hypothetical protein